MFWDKDGGGTIEQNEISKSFCQLGLSQDHNFAKKIMTYIKPPTDADDFSNWSISLKDFITVFRED